MRHVRASAPPSRSPSRIASTARAQCAVIVPSTPIDVSRAAFASSRACLALGPTPAAASACAAVSSARRNASLQPDQCARGRSQDRTQPERCTGASEPQTRPDTPPGLPPSAPYRLLRRGTPRLACTRAAQSNHRLDRQRVWQHKVEPASLGVLDLLVGDRRRLMRTWPWTRARSQTRCGMTTAPPGRRQTAATAEQPDHSGRSTGCPKRVSNASFRSAMRTWSSGLVASMRSRDAASRSAASRMLQFDRGNQLSESRSAHQLGRSRGLLRVPEVGSAPAPRATRRERRAPPRSWPEPPDPVVR